MRLYNEHLCFKNKVIQIFVYKGTTRPDNPFQEKEMLKHLLAELLGSYKWEIN